MATFTAQGAFNTAAIPVMDEEHATLLVSTDTAWSFSDGHVTYTYGGTGFSFDNSGEIITGVVTSWSIAVEGLTVFSVTGTSYSVTGPNNPAILLGYDIQDGGYPQASGHPVYHEQADLAWMLRGDDVMNGSSFADQMSGFEGHDQLNGNAGNDTLRGWGGDDTLDGGTGIDIAAYFNVRTESQVTPAGNGWTVTAPSGGGTDSVLNVERLVFSGSVGVALDLDGHAGQVARLIGAVFGSATLSNLDIVGIGLQYADSGMAYEDLGALAMSARGITTHAAVVETLWANVIGSPLSAGQEAIFVGMLDSGTSIGALVALAADTEINESNIGLAGLAQSGLAFHYQGTLAY